MKSSLSKALKAFMQIHHLTQNDVSSLAKVSQPVVSRVLKGSWTRRTKKIDAICRCIGYKEYVDPRSSDILINALKEVWNGEEKHAILIADMLRSIGKLTRESSHEN